MSTKKGVRKIVHGERVTLVDAETGAAAAGDTYPEALEQLADHIRRARDATDRVTELEDIGDSDEAVAETIERIGRMHEAGKFIRLSESVQRRFEEENVTEEDVEDAIEWARSQ